MKTNNRIEYLEQRLATLKKVRLNATSETRRDNLFDKIMSVRKEIRFLKSH